MIPFKILKVTVVRDQGPDDIIIDLDGPSTMPAIDAKLHVKTEAAHGFGVQWVRDNLGVEPELIIVPSARLTTTRPEG